MRLELFVFSLTSCGIAEVLGAEGTLMKYIAANKDTATAMTDSTFNTGLRARFYRW